MIDFHGSQHAAEKQPANAAIDSHVYEADTQAI
jgi:hypothetical protein